MIHWVTYNDHAGSHKHTASWKPATATLNSADSRASRVLGGGVFGPQREKERSSYASRMLSRYGRTKETMEDCTDSDSWLYPQHIPNDGERVTTQRPGRFGAGVYDDCNMVDLESGPASSDHMANSQNDDFSTVATANMDETRHTENLKPLPLVCRRTGMSPSI